MWQLFNPERLPLKPWRQEMRNSVPYSLCGFKRQSWNILLPEWNLPSLLNYLTQSVGAESMQMIKAVFRVLLHTLAGDGEEGILATYIYPRWRSMWVQTQFRGRVHAVSTQRSTDWCKVMQTVQGCESAALGSFIMCEDKALQMKSRELSRTISRPRKPTEMGTLEPRICKFHELFFFLGGVYSLCLFSLCPVFEKWYIILVITFENIKNK